MSRSDPNVDADEIEKFERLADRWWNRNGELRPLHDINPVRVRYIDERAPVAGKQVLDVGCGGGILAEAMAARGALVTGIDAGEAPLAAARAHRLVSGLEIDYQRSTAEALASREAGRFDVVVCLELLEHVPDPGSVVRACATLARPGGQVFFSTINRNPKAYVLVVLGAEYLLGLLPRGTHDYARFLRPSELYDCAGSAGLKLKEITGLTYNPLTRIHRLTGDVSVNYLAWLEVTGEPAG